MTLTEIQDDIKAGKKFKRKEWPFWLIANGQGFLTRDTDGAVDHLCLQDLFAADWEVEEKQVTITKSILAEKWDANMDAHSYDSAAESKAFKMICKILDL